MISSAVVLRNRNRRKKKRAAGGKDPVVLRTRNRRKKKRAAGGKDPDGAEEDNIMSGLYLENGFFDFGEAVRRSTAFNFIIGGRGTGKTYGALKWCIESGKKFLFMRRLQKEADIINTSTEIKRIYGTLATTL